MAADTPAAVIEQGTVARQRTVKGTLTTLVDRATAAGVRSPAVVVIGRVVDLSSLLSWFAPAADSASQTSHLLP